MSGRWLVMVGCDETPEEYRHRIGFAVEVPEDTLVPCPGSEGRLFGVPGRMLEDGRWEIRPVDMRTQAEKWLDAADELLRQEPIAGENLHEIQRRAVRAQWLILKAQARMVRGMR